MLHNTKDSNDRDDDCRTKEQTAKLGNPFTLICQCNKPAPILLSTRKMYNSANELNMKSLTSALFHALSSPFAFYLFTQKTPANRPAKTKKKKKEEKQQQKNNNRICRSNDKRTHVLLCKTSINV